MALAPAHFFFSSQKSGRQLFPTIRRQCLPTLAATFSVFLPAYFLEGPSATHFFSRNFLRTGMPPSGQFESQSASRRVTGTYLLAEPAGQGP